MRYMIFALGLMLMLLRAVEHAQLNVQSLANERQASGIAPLQVFPHRYNLV
jgi:hypothetical protein